MTDKKKFPGNDIKNILNLYGLGVFFEEQIEYVNYRDEYGNVKVIISVLTKSGKRVVIKVVNDCDDNLLQSREKIEKQSAFSEFMRKNGILTPKRYTSNGKYCIEYLYNCLPCNVTVEDWCGEEITAINDDIAYKIGRLMARMHIVSLNVNYEIGYGTLFSAAEKNDVDVYDTFCKICENERLDQTIVNQIKKYRKEKLEAIRSVWNKLPKASVQGDLSINNLVYRQGELVVFDYNNAGNVVLVSDLVLEGLLTAYEMDLPEGACEDERKGLFSALLSGYLSLRDLSEEEATVAWNVYTLYNSLWFSKITYTENSLDKLVKREDYEGANRLLSQMLTDITASDDGRFKVICK